MRQSSKIRHRNSQDNLLFGSDATYAKLASLLSRGAEVRTTKLSEKFGWEEYCKAHGELILLFAVDPDGRLHVHQAGDTPAVEAGWTVLSLVSPDELALKAPAHSIKAES